REHRAAHDLLLQHHAEVLAAAGQRTQETVGELERAHREARDALELQLFALRCDLQRAVNHSAQRGESARAAEDAAKDLSHTIDMLRAEKVELERRIAEMEARAVSPPVTQGDFNRLQTNLLGRVNLVSSDIDR